MKQFFGLVALSSALFAAENSHPHVYSFKPILLNTRENSIYSEKIGHEIYKVPTTGGTAEYVYLTPNEFYLDGSFTFLLSDKKPRGNYELFRSKRMLSQFSFGYTLGNNNAFIIPFLGFGYQRKSEVGKWAIREIVPIPEEEQEKDEQGNPITEKLEVTWFKEEQIERNWLNEIGLRTQVTFFEGLYLGMRGSVFIIPKNFNIQRGWGYQVTLPVGYYNEYFDFAISPLMRTEYIKQTETFRASFQDLGASFDLSISF